MINISTHNNNVIVRTVKNNQARQAAGGASGTELSDADFVTPRTFPLGGDRLAYGGLCTPFEDSEFRPQLKRLADLVKRSRSFLDIGCGVGNMLEWAKELNSELSVTGLEVRPAAVRVASRVGSVIKADALKFDRYHGFDLLYMYRPLVEYRHQLLLENHVIERMRVGATLVSLLPAHYRLCGAGAHGIYTKEAE